MADGIVRPFPSALIARLVVGAVFACTKVSLNFDVDLLGLMCDCTVICRHPVGKSGRPLDAPSTQHVWVWRRQRG
jgi:hypothetical protein